MLQGQMVTPLLRHTFSLGSAPSAKPFFPPSVIESFNEAANKGLPGLGGCIFAPIEYDIEEPLRGARDLPIHPLPAWAWIRAYRHPHPLLTPRFKTTKSTGTHFRSFQVDFNTLTRNAKTPIWNCSATPEAPCLNIDHFRPHPVAVAGVYRLFHGLLREDELFTEILNFAGYKLQDFYDFFVIKPRVQRTIWVAVAQTLDPMAHLAGLRYYKSGKEKPIKYWGDVLHVDPIDQGPGQEEAEKLIFILTAMLDVIKLKTWMDPGSMSNYPTLPRIPGYEGRTASTYPDWVKNYLSPMKGKPL